MNETWSIEQHLEELRFRLLFCILSFIPCLLIGFYYCPTVLQLLEGLAPAQTVFFQFKPGEFLFTYCKLASLLSILLTSPILIWQTLAFLWSGLKQNEKVISLILAVGIPSLFVIGNLFAYFLALKPILGFLLGFGVEKNLIKAQYSIDYFVSLIIALSIMFGVVFQIPIILFIFAIFKLITSDTMWKFWKQAIFISFIIAAVATPTPDPFNMLILGFAICALYAISLLLIKVLESFVK